MIQERIIIDTDIGDDIDDALALAFALHCPEVEVLGVTTVFGNTAARAQTGSCLLQHAGEVKSEAFMELFLNRIR